MSGYTETDIKNLSLVIPKPWYQLYFQFKYGTHW